MSRPSLAVVRTPLVAVYDTLKRGLRNHHWLEDAEFLGSDSLHRVTLYDLGPFPAAGLYQRRVDTTAYGAAWLYLYNPGVSPQAAIRQGGWQPRR